MRFMIENFCTNSATVVTASSSDVNFPVSNMKHPFRSKRWRSTDVTSESIVFDFVTTEPIDSVVLFWPKEDGIRLSETAVVKVQANATNVWTSPALDEVVGIDNTYMVATKFFTEDKNYRYWRIVIEDPGNAYGYLELGLAWMGKGLDLEDVQNGFKYSLVDQSKSTRTDFGHVYTDEYPLASMVEFSYQYLDYDVVQTLENAFRRNGSRLPVLAVLDAEAAVFNENHLLVYGLMKPSFESNHLFYNVLNPSGLVVTELA